MELVLMIVVMILQIVTLCIVCAKELNFDERFEDKTNDMQVQQKKREIDDYMRDIDVMNKYGIDE